MNSNKGESKKYSPIHINKAKNAPAVPGAIGTKPVPKLLK